jgi:hypothetical protein
MGSRQRWWLLRSRPLRAALVRRPAARVGRAGDIDSGAALFDEDDFALLIDHERGAIGDSAIGHEYPISRGSLAGCKIAYERKGKGELLGKFTLGRNIIGADSQDLSLGGVKFGNTSLVSREFLRSTTGEGGRKERDYNGLLSSKIGELDLAALSGWQLEVGGHISYFEVGFRRRSRRLSPSRRQTRG